MRSLSWESDPPTRLPKLALLVDTIELSSMTRDGGPPSLGEGRRMETRDRETCVDRADRSS